MLNVNNKDNSLPYLMLALGMLPVIGDLIYFGKDLFQPLAESINKGYPAYRAFWRPGNVFQEKGYLMRAWFLFCTLVFAFITPLRKREIKNVGFVYAMAIAFLVAIIFIPLIYKLGAGAGNIIYLVAIFGFVGTTSALASYHNIGFGNTNSEIKQNTKDQETRYSVNFSTDYNKGQGRVNVLNPFSGTYVVGAPNSGKSHTIIAEYIIQLLNKGFVGMIYDFKAFDLGKLAYNVWLDIGKSGIGFTHDIADINNNIVSKEIPFPDMWFISFQNLTRSHRCNPIHPEIIQNVTEARTAINAVLFTYTGVD